MNRMFFVPCSAFGWMLSRKPAQRCVCQLSLQTRSQIASCDTWKEKSCFSLRSVD